MLLHEFRKSNESITDLMTKNCFSMINICTDNDDENDSQIKATHQINRAMLQDLWSYTFDFIKNHTNNHSNIFAKRYKPKTCKTSIWSQKKLLSVSHKTRTLKSNHILPLCFGAFYASFWLMHKKVQLNAMMPTLVPLCKTFHTTTH